MEGNEETVQEELKKSELVLISKTDLIELINPIIEGINKLGENQVQIYKKLGEISNSYAIKKLEEDLKVADDINHRRAQNIYDLVERTRITVCNYCNRLCDASNC